MKGFIYKLSATDNDGLERVYIGSSDRTPELRFQWHRFECSTCSCYKVFCDIGWDNVEMLVLEIDIGDDLRQKEQYYMNQYNELEGYINQKRAYTGIEVSCKENPNEYAKQYRIKYADEIELKKPETQRQQKEYYKNNKEKILEDVKKYNHSEQGKDTRKKYNENNRDHINFVKREYVKNNPEYHEKKLNIDSEYRKANKEVLSQKASEKVICDHCGSSSTKRNIAEHKKSAKCKNYNK